MGTTEVLYHQDGPIGRITFSTDDGINLMSTPVMAAMECRLDDIRNNHPEVRVLIFTGAGKTFLAGADIREMDRAPGDAGKAFAQRGQRFMNTLARYEQAVTIAAINGPALGGGCELALACDLRVMAREATIGFPEVKLGLIPGWGGTQRAFALMGPAKARRMIFVGEALPGDVAAEAELVNEVVPGDDLMTVVDAMARRILANGPGAVRLAKRVVCATEQHWLERSMMSEAEAFGEAFISGEGREGLRAFVEKRQPAWE
ncbi:MAG: enoyl-CoA hydratase/isomerase family protein [Phycisphaerae bacterium]|nr:enoyl-CoA hydratase/isomerase family protein [Phycisphaerae bacterium]